MRLQAKSLRSKVLGSKRKRACAPAPRSCRWKIMPLTWTSSERGTPASRKVFRNMLVCTSMSAGIRQAGEFRLHRMRPYAIKTRQLHAEINRASNPRRERNDIANGSYAGDLARAAPHYRCQPGGVSQTV